MNKIIRRLPDTELEVMQAIWSSTPPVCKTDIEQNIYKTHPMAQTTLLTLLTRLQEKQFLDVEIIKRKKYYTPRVSRKDYLAVQSRSFYDRVCGGDISAFANALCDSGISQEELETLRQFLMGDSL